MTTGSVKFMSPRDSKVYDLTVDVAFDDEHVVGGAVHPDAGEVGEDVLHPVAVDGAEDVHVAGGGHVADHLQVGEERQRACRRCQPVSGTIQSVPHARW